MLEAATRWDDRGCPTETRPRVMMPRNDDALGNVEPHEALTVAFTDERNVVFPGGEFR